MFEKFRKKKETVISKPVQGKLIPLAEVEDAVFSTGLMGFGFAVIPTEGEIYAPTTGTITSIFSTKHAITMTTTNGLELLIHMGIDTVELNGEGITSLVEVGDKVTATTKIAVIDLDLLTQREKKTDIIVVFLNITPEQKEKFDLSGITPIAVLS
ncbi:PTS system, sugar-specific IIA component [Enterococcus sp. AZ194]|uniref:PTS sugar transporter subunit IIA n=1 Tax=Enterococcus sp. AZ194 TaxID=2774629 RepID=UPI003F21D34E